MKIKIKMKRGKKRGEREEKKMKLWDKQMMLNTYSHVLPTMQREVADKLDEMFG
ncbi:hypothetical protein Q9G86_14775 [Bacillus thuringiensis]|uniref:hypothetical protein n=1 Tax=Bacillus thuringiensis TaxID=1428 RepID=UPI00273BD8C2|nr:hypothetical protein [Bacillus thuringiensis]WLP61935.1 hypothetical protein Q9G86_14775 [Bacillus thuringiensis]